MNFSFLRNFLRIGPVLYLRLKRFLYVRLRSSGKPSSTRKGDREAVEGVFSVNGHMKSEQNVKYASKVRFWRFSFAVLLAIIT